MIYEVEIDGEIYEVDVDSPDQIDGVVAEIRGSENPEPEKSEPSILERASSFYESKLKPAAADAYDTVVRDGAGEFVKRINRGVLSFADIPADLAEMAGASPEQTFRLTDLFDGTPLDMTPNPEAWVNKPIVRDQSYGDFVQTLGAFGPSTVPVNSGIKYLDDLIEASGRPYQHLLQYSSLWRLLEVADRLA